MPTNGVTFIDQDLPFAKVEVGDEIDLLIGLNAIDLHSVLDECHGEPGDPIARKTPLGWVCFGPVLTVGTSNSPTVRSCQTHVALTFFSAADSRLNDIVDSFWELEKVGMKTPYRTPAEAEAEDYVSRTMGLTDEGRVQVAIPWIGHQGKPDLKSNRQMAERRLESPERFLRKHGPDVEKEYSRVLEAQEAKGYNHKVQEEEVKKELATSFATPANSWCLEPSRYSSWKRLVRVTSWCLRFIERCRFRVRNSLITREETQCELAVDENQQAASVDLNLSMQKLEL